MKPSTIKQILKNNGDVFLPALTERIKSEIVNTFETVYNSTDVPVDVATIARTQGYLKGLKFCLACFNEIVEDQRKAYD